METLTATPTNPIIIGNATEADPVFKTPNPENAKPRKAISQFIELGYKALLILHSIERLLVIVLQRLCHVLSFSAGR